MKKETRVIAISIFLGLVVWLIDAVFDYFIFHEGTFLDMLIFDVPDHEMYIRFVVLFSFAIFGIIISKIMIKRKQAEEALRFERDNFINILNSMEDGVCIVDQQYNIQYINPTLVKDYGLPEGHKCHEYFHDRKEVCPWCRNQKVFAGKSVHWEWHSVKNNRTYDIINTPLENLDGTISKLEIHHDITKRKKNEGKLKKYAEDLKHSNELKDLFTDILRHDLLNPAGVIKGYTELLLDVEGDEKKSKFLQKIEQNNEKLIDIIETAAKFAKFESVEELEFEPKDISIIVKEVADNFRPLIMSKQMEFEFKADGAYPANVNPVIGEVFSNLLSNAIKYSSNGSRIIVDILDVGDMWKLTVTDSGEGVSDDDKPILFDRFKRVNKKCIKGSGLGLAIVKRIIELHGGSVGVEDNPAGDGCVFWLTVGKA